jgi:hypothetical protein
MPQSEKQDTPMEKIGASAPIYTPVTLLPKASLVRQVLPICHGVRPFAPSRFRSAYAEENGGYCGLAEFHQRGRDSISGNFMGPEQLWQLLSEGNSISLNY